MGLKSKIISLLLVTSICGTMTACGGSDDVEIIVMQPYDVTMEYSETFNSAENVAVQFQNYVRNGYWKLAYSLVDMPADVLLAPDDFSSVETEISELDSSWQLYNVQSSGSSVRLTYGEKVGEAYTKGKESTYMGDMVDFTLTVDLPIVTSSDGKVMIGVKDSWVTSDVIALKVPDYCGVSIGGIALADVSRDDAGYYLITRFSGGDSLSVTLTSDVESRVITLNLADTASEDASANGEPVETVSDPTMLNSAGQHLGYKAFVYNWETSRLTNEDALEYSETAIQAVLTSICDQEPFYSGNFLSVMSKKANLEALKPYYIKAQSLFEDTKNRDYNDLTVISVLPWSAENMRKKGVSWHMVDKETMSIWVDVNYSYVITTTADGSTKVKTGVATGEVTLTKDNGEWRLMGISDKILKAII